MPNQRTCKPFEKPRNKPVIICESIKSDDRKLQDQKINQPSRIKNKLQHKQRLIHYKLQGTTS